MSRGTSALPSLLCALAGAYLLTCVPARSSVPAEPRAAALARGASSPSLLPLARTAAPRTTTSATRQQTASTAPQPSCHATSADRYAVVSESAAAAEAAISVLAEGGSAADAAVIGVLVAGVTEPVSSGLGGGGFALVWDAQAKRAVALDFREAAPMGLHPEHYHARPVAASRRGVLVGVPGELAGLAELHARWGRLPFAALAGRAAEIADRGFRVSHHLSRALRWNQSWVVQTPEVAALFAPLGSLLAPDAQAKNPRLGRTLARIATEGRAAFYQGQIAAEVVDTARRAGSSMNADDLDRYRVLERVPLALPWHEHQVLTMPPPSGGGLLLAETLGMHTPAELRALGYGSGAYGHVLCETFRLALADRVRAIGDPAFIRMDLRALLAPERLQARRARIALGRTLPAGGLSVADSGTSSLLAVDAAGNVVSVSSTVNGMFGARLLTAGGFVLNDTLADFTNRRLEQLFEAGLRPNSPKGGARPVSSMTPTIVLRNGAPVLALGGSGGATIGPDVTQVLLGKLLFGRATEQAVADLRFRAPPGGGLLVEPEAEAALVADLRARGEVVDSRPSYGAVGLLAIESGPCGRRLEASGDPRKGAVGMVE